MYARPGGAFEKKHVIFFLAYICKLANGIDFIKIYRKRIVWRDKTDIKLCDGLEGADLKRQVILPHIRRANGLFATSRM